MTYSKHYDCSQNNTTFGEYQQQTDNKTLLYQTFVSHVVNILKWSQLRHKNFLDRFGKRLLFGLI